jgi:hypothetical protein
MASVELQILRDMVDYENANKVHRRFIDDIQHGKHEFVNISSGVYVRSICGIESTFNIYYTTLFGCITIKPFKSRIHIITLGDEFRDISIMCEKGLYSNSCYRDYNDIEERVLKWKYYHDYTFQYFWNHWKSIFKEYALIDLDLLYGDD